MVEIPSSVGNISAGWLRASVRPEDAAAFTSLTSVRVERLAEGAAMATDIYRLVLGYAAGATQGPATLVAKLPSSSPAVLEVARGWGHYQREVLFYQDVAATVALRIPKAYVAKFDPQTNGFVLVMEDLAPAVNGNQVAGFPLDHVCGWRWMRSPACMRPGGIGLSCSHWKQPSNPWERSNWIGTGARHAAAWPAFEKFVSARASPELSRVGERMASAIEPMMVDLARVRRTPLPRRLSRRQSDVRAWRWRQAHHPRLAGPHAGPWRPFDVGHLMSMSVTVELHVAPMRRRFCMATTTSWWLAGVEHYPYDEFFQDYRRGLLIGFTYVIQTGPAVDMANARTEALFDGAIRRLDAAVRDHGLGEFVD